MGKRRRRRTKNETQELAEPIVLAESPRGIRAPVPKLHFPGFNKDTKRTMTVQQFAVLLWCLYQTSQREELGYLDAYKPLQKFIKQFCQTINMNKLDLERLLHAGNMADLNGFFWSPDGKTFEEFIRPMLFNNEVFDRQWNLVTTVEDGRALKKKTRFIKKLTNKRWRE